MKFSVRQILASAAGAVIAAVIASAFGVKGTIVGVAIGSAAATFGTALVAQSIERGHRGRQAGGRAGPRVLPVAAQAGRDRHQQRRGFAGRRVDADRVHGARCRSGHGRDGVVGARRRRGPNTWRSRPWPSAPATQRIDATTLPMQPAGPSGGRAARGHSRWTTIAGTAAVVFVIALMFITAIELISGKPLAAIFGNTGGGTTVKNIFTPSPSPSPSPAPTTTTTRLADLDDDLDDDLVHARRRPARRPARRRRRAPPRRSPPGASTTTTAPNGSVAIDDDVVAGAAIALRSGVTSP